MVSAANVRQGPDVTQPIVAVVREDTRLRVLGQDATGSWIEVQLADGAVGWIGSSVVEAVDPAAEDDDT